MDLTEVVAGPGIVGEGRGRMAERRGRHGKGIHSGGFVGREHGAPFGREAGVGFAGAEASAGTRLCVDGAFFWWE